MDNKLTGLRIDELETMETNACSLVGDQAEPSDKIAYQLSMKRTRSSG